MDNCCGLMTTACPSESDAILTCSSVCVCVCVQKSVPLEVNLLQLFFAYIQQHSGLQLLDSWPALLSLIREVMTMGLQPPSTFLLLQ